MENIITAVCVVCNGELETIRAGIRVDCPACDGFGVTVQTFHDSECIPDNSSLPDFDFAIACMARDFK